MHKGSVQLDPTYQMTPEAAMLLACVRRFVRGGSHDELHEVLRGDIEWPLLIKMAEAQSVMPLLYRELESEFPGRAPQELRTRFQNHARSNLIQTAEIVKVLDLLEQSEIPAIPLKGPALAAWAYGNLTYRAFTDLDLLIHRDDVPLAKEALVRAGFRLESDVHWPCASAYVRSKERELSFVRPANRVRVDLHWSLSPDYFAGALDGDQIWENLATVPLAGRQVPALSPEILLMFLCAHGSKHRWECLGWICDVALVLRRSEIDWSRLLSRSRQAHIERMVLLGLRLAIDLFDVDLPANVVDRIQADSAIADLANEIRRGILATDSSHASPVKNGLFNLRMLKRFRDKINFLRGLLITPSESEWRDLQLPPTLYFLYYPYRLARLAGRRASAALPQ